LTPKLTQVVKFGSTDASAFDHIYMINDRCMQWKDALDTDTERSLSNRYCFSYALSAARNDNPFERLQTFFVFTFLDANVDANGITGNEIRNIALQLCLFDIVQSVHCVTSSIIHI